jgi:hypothetical protein
VVDRSHVAMSLLSSHVNIHNSYSSTDMSKWSNHNAYIFEHVSNIHNGFVTSYLATEPTSHCTPQTHMPIINCHSRDDMRVSDDFGQSQYTAPDLLRIEIAQNMVSSSHIASSIFHSTSPIYSRVEESSANTPASNTNRSDIDKGSDIKLTIETCR